MKKLLLILLCSYCGFLFTAAQNITTAEYFIDTDPGMGNGTALNVGVSGTTVNFVATFPVGALSTGFHFVAIRTKDADGKWGLFENRGFYISGQTSNVTNIIAAEYYYDTDPGIGNGTAINIPSPVSVYQDSLILPLGSLPLGNHRIAIRVKNADGQWSLLEERPFTLVQIPLPVSLLSFDARKSADGKKAELHWVTTFEQNVSRFEIQRSTDGINYSKIGVVNALNIITGSSYSWQDIAPLMGVNYYRLRMVDTDASSKMSPVKTLRFVEKYELLVFPTLTSNLVFIQSPKEVTAQLINMLGVVVQQKVVRGSSSFDLSGLPSGIYMIRVVGEKRIFKIMKQ